MKINPANAVADMILTAAVRIAWVISPAEREELDAIMRTLIADCDESDQEIRLFLAVRDMLTHISHEDAK